MKKRFITFLSFSFALLLCTITTAQEGHGVQKDVKTQTKKSTSLETAPPPPPPPPPAPEDPLFKVVENMPRFPGCEDQDLARAELEKCSKTKLLEYIYKNLKYPAFAKEQKVEGIVVIQFVVDKDGSLINLNIVRDPGPENANENQKSCGMAALDVMKKMQSEMKWVAGKQRGRPVKVQYTLPINFKL